MHHRDRSAFFSRERIARILLLAMISVAGVTPTAWAGPGDGYGGPYFSDGNIPPGCEADMVKDTPAYWNPGGGGLLGGAAGTTEAVCHHMRTEINHLGSPEVDVLIMVPISPTTERDMRVMRQSIESGKRASATSLVKWGWDG